MHIAILDDDLTHLQLFEHALNQSANSGLLDVNCHFFHSGEALLRKLHGHNFDAVILDRQVPDVSGDDILIWLRHNAPPETVVIMVTSLAGPEEVVLMLNLGADDYVTKPFDGAELLARVRRLLERSGKSFTQTVLPNEFSLHGLEFDRLNLTISHGDEVTLCSVREFDLMVFLFNHVGQPLSRKKIYEAVWQRRSVDTSRALDAQMHRVRTKFGLTSENGFVLQPIYGVGYRLDIIQPTGGVLED